MRRVGRSRAYFFPLGASWQIRSKSGRQISATASPKKWPSFRAVVSETSLSCFSISCKVETERPVLPEICLRVSPR